MKKYLILYHSFVHLISVLVSFISIVSYDFKFNNVIIFTISLLFLIPSYQYYLRKNEDKSIFFMWVFNLLQSFSLIFKGLTYKLVFGPDFSFYLIKSQDLVTQFSFKFFNIYAYFNYVNGEVYAIGFNFIHFVFFSYFFYIYKKNPDNYGFSK
jgi:hypothetical protein